MLNWMQSHSKFMAEDVRSILGRTITAADHHAGFDSMLEFVTLQALLAFRKDTNSYRGFRVGCAVYAHNGENRRADSHARVFMAGNEKQTPETIKLCAERKAILKARSARYPHIVGMVIVGEPQGDKDSLLVTPTLHSCLSCRNFFQSTSGITADTQIVTIEPKSGEHERMTVGEMIRLHQGF